LLAFCPALARATPLPPGGSVSGSTPGNVLQTYSGSVVSVIDFQQSTFFINNPHNLLLGFVSSAVVQTTSPGLDFLYQVNVSAGTVNSLTINSFHNMTTDASQIQSRQVLAGQNLFFPGNVQIQTYTRTGGTGDDINLLFSGNGVTAEQSSYLVIVHTNSTTFTKSTASVIAGGTGLTVASLAPVPEPQTMVLWGGTFGGAACFIAWRLRRRALAALA
jgi:hypothetical protein